MLISTWSSTIVALGGRDSTCVASWVYRSAEQGVRIQPVLLCRRLPAQRSKALSCEEQVETARRVWEEKAMRMWAWIEWTILSIYALQFLVAQQAAVTSGGRCEGLGVERLPRCLPYGWGEPRFCGKCWASWIFDDFCLLWFVNLYVCGLMEHYFIIYHMYVCIYIYIYIHTVYVLIINVMLRLFG